jgi:hypothetical protein
MNNLEDLMSNNQERNKMLKMALETVYPIREKLQNELIETENEETRDLLLDKVIALNKIISDAESVVDMTGEEALDWYVKKFPQYVNEDKTINDRGIKRFNIINKKWKKFGFLK